MQGERLLEGVRILALASIGLGVGLHYARMGYMPLDHSVCFDGGWRVLCGQVPFRDYVAPSGLTVHALQAVFFALFGVTWFAYCLHAAVFNALAVLGVDRLLVLLGLERAWSSVFALCTAFVFFPPVGVPMMDSHAFFFSLAALLAALAAARAASARTRRWSAYAVGPLLALAFLSKQIPSVFFLPATLALALWSLDRRRTTFVRVLAGLAATAAVCALALAALGVDWELVDTYWRRLPSAEGSRRLALFSSPQSLVHRFVETWRDLGLLSPAAAFGAGLAGLLLPLLPARFRRGAALSRTWPCCALAVFLTLAALFFVTWTFNQEEIGVPLVFAASGCVAAASLHLSASAREHGKPRLAGALWLALPLLAAAAVLDAWAFAREVDATRRANDLVFDARAAGEASRELPEGLAYLRWCVPKLVRYSPGDLCALVEYLRARAGGVFLLGDTSIVYGLSGKESVAPSLWFHPGLTAPRPYDRGFERYQALLLRRFRELDVQTVVVEGERTWVGYRANPGKKPPEFAYFTLATWPKLARLVEERRRAERSFGPFRAIELGP